MAELETLLQYARHVVKGPSVRRSLPAGYDIKPDEKVLLAVDTYQDMAVVEAFLQAIREAGAEVDLFVADAGPDREMDEVDEIRAFFGNTPWGKEPEEPWPWVVQIEKLAAEGGYDLLIRGIGGPTRNTSYRYEGFPWISRELLTSPATTFPYEVWDLLERKSWSTIWEHGPGGRVRVTDPEGTDFSYTMHEEHFQNQRYGFTPEPFHGHLHAHHPPPYMDKDDTEGVVAGTLNHWGLPHPHIKVNVERGMVQSVEEGGEYGEVWRELMDMGKDIKYPEYPRPGLFFLWEVAIGTNPKFFRPKNVLKRSRGMVYERLRSGIIHVGMGTRILSQSEEWAKKEGVPYGHLHVHLLFPTYTLTSKKGETFTIIDKGHLTSLDDPDVIRLAEKFGDPREILKEDWIPRIPGISIPGDYWKDYAPDPAGWIRQDKESD